MFSGMPARQQTVYRLLVETLGLKRRATDSQQSSEVHFGGSGLCRMLEKSDKGVRHEEMTGMTEEAKG